MARTYQLGLIRRTFNTIMKATLRVGVGARSTYLLTTTGARTGLQRTTPVTLVETDAGRWLVAPYGNVGWVHNVRAEPRVTLRRGRSAQVVRVREVDAETAGPILRDYLRHGRITAPYFDARADDVVQRFVDEAAGHPVFALTS